MKPSRIFINKKQIVSQLYFHTSIDVHKKLAKYGTRNWNNIKYFGYSLINLILAILGDSGIGFLFVRIAAGITTGTLAIFSAQPTDVVKVRMQAEMKKIGEKSRYKGVVDAYVTIAKTEGFQGLYKGMYTDMILILIVYLSLLCV